jgi:hypothetical protein
MKEYNKNLFNKVNNSLNLLNKNHKIANYEQLFSLYDSVVNNQPNKKKYYFNYNIDNNIINNDYKGNNFISQIIKDKINERKLYLFNHNNDMTKSYNKDQNNINSNNINLAKSQNYKTFITSDYIQSNKVNNEEEQKNIIHVGKSLNDILIKNINDEMINKGILIQRPFSKKKKCVTQQNSKNKNFNNYQMHMDLFSDKMKKEFNNYLKEYKLSQKKTLRSVSKEIADKKAKMTKIIPIYIKGFKKDLIDIFHSRKILDLEYQKLYSKPCVNIEEILHYQNKNGNNEFKKGKIPFYWFLRTVNNPYSKKTKIKQQRPHSGNIFIKFTSDE